MAIRKISDPYSVTVSIILAFVMIFMPLARGGVHSWAQTVFTICVILMAGILLLQRLNTGKPALNGTKLFYPFIALLLWMLFSFLFSPVKTAGFEAISTTLIYILFYYILIHLVQSRKQQRFIVYLLIGISLLLSIIGLLKLGGITFPWWEYEELNKKNFLTSTYGNHNHIAGYLEMIIPLILALFLTRSRKGVIFVCLLLIAFVVIGSHVLTLSRGGWVAMFSSLVFMSAMLLSLKKYNRKKLLLIGNGVVLGLFLFVLAGTNMLERALTLTEADTVVSLNGRSFVWEGTYAMIGEGIFVGSGPGSYSTIITQYLPSGISSRFFYAHNEYLQLIAELGLPIILIMIWGLFHLIKEVQQKFRSSSRQTWGVTLGAITGVVAILFHSCVDFNLHIHANSVLFATLIALVFFEVSKD